jgi:hypothetical protein
MMDASVSKLEETSIVAVSDPTTAIARETSLRFPVKDEGEMITQSLLAPLLLISSLLLLSSLLLPTSLELTGTPQISE